MGEVVFLLTMAGLFALIFLWVRWNNREHERRLHRSRRKRDGITYLYTEGSDYIAGGYDYGVGDFGVGDFGGAGGDGGGGDG
jgi:hypothetical protein